MFSARRFAPIESIFDRIESVILNELNTNISSSIFESLRIVLPDLVYQRRIGLQVYSERHPRGTRTHTAIATARTKYLIDDVMGRKNPAPAKVRNIVYENQKTPRCL